jgi:hypothetical protein
VLYRPLFFTSFVLADFLVDGGTAGARTVVLSSASSKTAYGAAFLLQSAGVRTVGLTSAGNVAFTPAWAATTRCCRTTGDRTAGRAGGGTSTAPGSTPLRRRCTTTSASRSRWTSWSG